MQAERQHGLLTRPALVDLGWSSSAIDRLRQSGWLRTIHPGVYACPGSADSWERSVQAAVLRTGGFASHRTAARMWGVWTSTEDPPIEVSVAGTKRHALRGVVVHRHHDVELGYVTERSGIAVSDPLRLLVELGQVEPEFVIKRALEHLNSRKHVSMEAVRGARLDFSCRGRDGVGVLGQVLDRWALGDRDTHSVAESRFAEVCERFALPTPIYQYEIAVDGLVRRLDFAYPERKLYIEVDGYAWHTREGVFEDDRERQNWLTIEGWLPIRITWKMLTTNPAGVARVIRKALGI